MKANRIWLRLSLVLLAAFVLSGLPLYALGEQDSQVQETAAPGEGERSPEASEPELEPFDPGHREAVAQFLRERRAYLIEVEQGREG